MSIIEQVWQIYFVQANIYFLLIFFYNIMMMLRFFKGFRGQPVIAVLLDTFANAFYDLIHFMFIFIVVFLSFAFGAHAVYGTSLEEYSTILKAIEAQFGILFGSFDFYAMYEISPVITLFFFWGYLIMVPFILLNMLVSIVIDNYQIIRKMTQTSALTIWQQM
jgi:polycystin 1L2